MQRSIVLYVGAFGFPTRDAGAARVLGIGKALRSLGYEVVFGGGESHGHRRLRRTFRLLLSGICLRPPR